MVTPQIIDIESFKDNRGYLSVIEVGNHIPFEVGASYWVNNLSKEKIHINTEHTDKIKLIIALSGEFEVILENGLTRSEFKLNRAFHGLLTPGGFNYTINHCDSKTVIFVMISK